VLSRVQGSLWVAALVLALYSAWQFATRWTAAGALRHDVQESAIYTPADVGSEVRIVMFYARDGIVTEGAATVLCYGVLNASAVRLDPPADAVWPSRNHCIDIRPQRNTRYTLTAQGSDGRNTSASFIVQVAPDPATLPKIDSFRVARCKKDYLGEPVFALSFSDHNAEEVSIDPPVFRPLAGAPMGQFYVAPETTTTYTLSVRGKYGHVVRQQLTVDVSTCQ
jgi:hypothetical protein